MKRRSYRPAYRIRTHRRSTAIAEQADEASLDRTALLRHGRPRRILIAESAYYRSRAAGRDSHDPLRDWLDAEREVDRMLRGESDGCAVEGGKGAA